jgi:SAM-dependent methyltransferase
MATERDFYESSYHFEYDAGFANDRRLSRVLDFLEPIAGCSVLDLGCGVGWAGELAHRRGGGPVTGIDFALKALRLGQQVAPHVSPVQGDGCRLPFASGSIDRLVSMGSLEHFPDVPLGLSEVSRVLRPSGRAVVVVPNFYVRTEQPQELAVSFSAWKRMFTAAGLAVEKVGADHGPPVFRDHRPARIAFRAAAKALAYVPRLPYQFIFCLVVD